MENAKKYVNKIMHDQKIYSKLGLIAPQYNHEWKKRNILIGENGSGKSRILQLIKENTQNYDCNVIYMDFANTNENLKCTEEITLAENLFFGRPIENKSIFEAFLATINNQILDIFQELTNLLAINTTYIRETAKEIIEKLKPSISSILHREIIIQKGTLMLYKKEYKKSLIEEWPLMSPGEKTILLIIVSVLIAALSDKPCILLIDELENHLHPEAQVKLYKLIKEGMDAATNDHCICIASHSLFLLPLFDIQEVVYMDNGMIQPIDGVLYQKIYDKLTGEGKTNKESLTDFLYSMSAWQYAEYLAQCFVAPIVVDRPSAEDEQALKFINAVKDIYEKKTCIDVLDFGAGSARIGKCIDLMLQDDKEKTSKLTKKLKYHIYDIMDISDEFKEKQNTDWRGIGFQSKEEIKKAGISFDIILLFNVLHEISVNEWERELNFLLNILAEDGMILFSERKVLSIGEKPYGKSGYLVLGKEELTKLFPDMEAKEIKLPERMREVTICYALKANSTKQLITDKNITNTLKELKDNTWTTIRAKQQDGIGRPQRAREYAFYCKQYVNAKEALEILQTSSISYTFADIMQSSLPRNKKRKMIQNLSTQDTDEGRKARAFLENNP